MTYPKKIDALIVEKDTTVAGAIQKILEDRDYAVTRLSMEADARRFLKESHISLVVAGEAEDSASPFHIMKEIVMASPVTSTILITDLSKAAVEQEAEGYGILGHVSRAVQREEMVSLLESFEQILSAF